MNLTTCAGHLTTDFGLLTSCTRVIPLVLNFSPHVLDSLPLVFDILPLVPDILPHILDFLPLAVGASSVYEFLQPFLHCDVLYPGVQPLSVEECLQDLALCVHVLRVLEQVPQIPVGFML